MVRVSSVFVDRETGDVDAVAVAVGVGVGVGVGVEDGVGDGVGVDVGDGVGEGDTLSLPGEGVGVDVGVAEISFCGDGVLLGVADFVGFEGVGVGDLRVPGGEDFAFGVAVGLGTGVCALRSMPR